MSGTFRLYEGILWEPPNGYFLIEEHLRRLEGSASHFRFSADMETVRKRLSEFATGLPDRPRKVRLEVSTDGAIRVADVDVKPSTPVRVELAREPVDSTDELLGHKSFLRDVYDRALAAHPSVQDVLLWNERRELTETCLANVVLEIEGRKLTPPVSCGLLPGTFRGVLVERGEIEEEILPIDSIERATKLFLVNSVRRWCDLLVGG